MHIFPRLYQSFSLTLCRPAKRKMCCTSHSRYSFQNKIDNNQCTKYSSFLSSAIAQMRTYPSIRSFRATTINENDRIGGTYVRYSYSAPSNLVAPLVYCESPRGTEDLGRVDICPRLWARTRPQRSHWATTSAKRNPTKSVCVCVYICVRLY